MKLFLIVVSVFLAIGAANAEETAQISLSVPAGIVKEACPTPVWKDLNVVWKGVTDKRASKEVGLQTQKGKEPIPVVANPPLDSTFDQALKNLFAGCGMKFVAEGSPDVLNLEAEIKEFYVGVEKKLVTGKSTAKGSVTFTASRRGTSSSVTVGYEIESKKIRSGNIKQLTTTINDLFAATLKQIPATDEIKELN